MQLHLLSSSGELFIEDAIEVARPLLTGSSEPEVAYLPAACLERSYSRETRAAFRGLAKVTFIKAESDPLKKIQSALDRDDRMGQFLQFHDHPVLAMQDDAYIQVTGAGLVLVRGTCWRFEKGKEKALIPPGKLET